MVTSLEAKAADCAITLLACSCGRSILDHALQSLQFRVRFHQRLYVLLEVWVRRGQSPSETELDFVVAEAVERGEKKAKTVIEEPITPQPLTEANLIFLEKEAIGRQHSTRIGRSRAQSRGRLSEPAIPRGSSKSIGSRESQISGPTTDT
ncbi:hypothetical protein N7G274_010398 [Stereocaulon virgatum]|uniref:Uncharacterized protein n=1 Tax=Stereocaulon virgatum TaxID=373712 RepID=A0ABR3ZVV8_9LECA